VVTNTIMPSKNRAKIKRLTRERLIKGTFVINLWHHSFYIQSLQKCCNYDTTVHYDCNHHTITWKLNFSRTKWGPRVSLDTLEQHHTASCLPFKKRLCAIPALFNRCAWYTKICVGCTTM